MARSRENANIIRDADVTDARPQKNWATQAMRSRNSAHLSPIDVCQMYCTANVYWPAASATSPGMANVTATSRMNPKITDTTTDMTMPIAAVREAFLVSSLMWADASYPVIVYCAIRSPIPHTTQNIGFEKPWPWNPEKFSVSVKTNESDLWWSGTMIRTPTTTATPAMCHQAEMLLIWARSRGPNVLMSPCSATTTV
jgi:hypothetical protein